MQKEMLFQRSENNDVETKNAISNVLIKIHDKKILFKFASIAKKKFGSDYIACPQAEMNV
jgi:hypothetical protein